MSSGTPWWGCQGEERTHCYGWTLMHVLTESVGGRGSVVGMDVGGVSACLSACHRQAVSV